MVAYSGEYENVIGPFVDGMRVKLMMSKHKGRSWLTQDLDQLFALMAGEVQELREAITNGNTIEVLLEACDVANFAMFISDVAIRAAQEAQLAATPREVLVPTVPARPAVDEAMWIDHGNWIPNSDHSVVVRMYKNSRTGQIVYEPHPLVADKKLPVAPWLVAERQPVAAAS